MRAVLVVMMVVVVVVKGAAVPAWRQAKASRLSRTHKSDQWCDEVLGCLEITNDWFSAMRPINVLPASRQHINTRFMIHTRSRRAIHENVYITADRASVDATTFDPKKPVKFIIHGFVDTGFIAWLREMADAMLDLADFNVIRVDWGGGSLPMYSSACANIRVVGLEVAYLVNFLVDEYGVDPADVHLIGHSLGAHSCGYAGERIKGLGRITGMDPAGPYFTGTADFIRLDPSDATFVDNIHTDADSILMLGYGTEEAMGHVDFYPNSGHDQPGCDPVSIGIEVITDIVDGIRDLAACSHARSYKVFTDSLKKPCPYLAHECYDYESFEMGRCASCGDDNSKCAYVGMQADEYPYPDRKNVKMYFDTDENPPYCYYHYQVIVDTTHPKNAEDWVQGHLTVWLYGDNGEVISKMRLTKAHERFDHGQPKYFMFKSHVDLSRVIRMEVKWEYDDTLTNPGSYCWLLFCNRALYLRSIMVSPMEYYPEANRLDHRRVLCQAGKEHVEVKDGHTQHLDWDESCVFTVG